MTPYILSRFCRAFKIMHLKLLLHFLININTFPFLAVSIYFLKGFCYCFICVYSNLIIRNRKLQLRNYPDKCDRIQIRFHMGSFVICTDNGLKHFLTSSISYVVLIDFPSRVMVLYLKSTPMIAI